MAAAAPVISHPDPLAPQSPAAIPGAEKGDRVDGEASGETGGETTPPLVSTKVACSSATPEACGSDTIVSPAPDKSTKKRKRKSNSGGADDAEEAKRLQAKKHSRATIPIEVQVAVGTPKHWWVQSVPPTKHRFQPVLGVHLRTRSQQWQLMRHLAGHCPLFHGAGPCALDQHTGVCSSIGGMVKHTLEKCDLGREHCEDCNIVATIVDDHVSECENGCCDIFCPTFMTSKNHMIINPHKVDLRIKRSNRISPRMWRT